MKVHSLHRWDLAPKEAIALQRQLAASLVQSPSLPLDTVELVGGVDVSSSKYSDQLTAGVVIWNRLTGMIVESVAIQQKEEFPYIPGLLSFREIPALAEAMKKLTTVPQVFLVDGHGRAHPRRMGIAAHLGLLIDIPTIGIAKSRLTGIYEEPGHTTGAVTPITDPSSGETLGMVMRTRPKVKPVFVSNGNGIDLNSAVAIVKECLRGYRLPEPTRLAHEYVNEVRRGAGADVLRVQEQLMM